MSVEASPSFSSAWATRRLSVPTGFAVHTPGKKEARSPLNLAVLSCRSEQAPGITDVKKDVIRYGSGAGLCEHKGDLLVEGASQERGRELGTRGVHRRLGPAKQKDGRRQGSRDRPSGRGAGARSGAAASSSESQPGHRAERGGSRRAR